MGDAADAAAADGETLFVVMPDKPAVPRRRAPTPADEPRRKLRITIPAALADELKQAVSVLPGSSLDELVEEALRRIVAERGAPSARPVRRGSVYDSSILVILP